jgi:hypothetical protein
MRVYLAFFRNNMRLTMRDRSVFIFNFLFPFIFFFGFAELFHAGTGQGIAFFVATVLVMGILGNGLRARVCGPCRSARAIFCGVTR